MGLVILLILQLIVSRGVSRNGKKASGEIKFFTGNTKFETKIMGIFHSGSGIIDIF